MELPTIDFWLYVATWLGFVIYVLYDRLQQEKQKNGTKKKE